MEVVCISDELEAIFREHWNHARHCENERLWFTNIYGVIVASILVFIGGTMNNQENVTLILLIVTFGLIFSVMGFLVVIALSLGYYYHIANVVMVFYRWNEMEFYRHPKKPVYFSDIHRYFFEITIAIFSALFFFFVTLNRTFARELPTNVVVPCITFATFVVIDALYLYKWEKYFRDCRRFMQALRNDFDGIFRDDWNWWFRREDFQRNIIEKAKDQNIPLPREEE